MRDDWVRGTGGPGSGDTLNPARCGMPGLLHSVNTAVDTHFSVFSLSLGAAPDCFRCSESLNRRNSSISSIRLSVCMEEEVLLSCSSPASPSPSTGLLSC